MGQSFIQFSMVSIFSKRGTNKQNKVLSLYIGIHLGIIINQTNLFEHMQVKLIEKRHQPFPVLNMDIFSLCTYDLNLMYLPLVLGETDVHVSKL